MEEHVYINPKDMPEPNGPYQYGRITNGWLHIAGQLPIDPDKPGEPIPKGIRKQTETVFKNIWRILDQAGYGPEDVVHVRNFLTDLSRDMQGFNEIYSRQFPAEHHPPRTTVGVSQLAKGALIEIDLVAYKQP